MSPAGCRSVVALVQLYGDPEWPEASGVQATRQETGAFDKGKLTNYWKIYLSMFNDVLPDVVCRKPLSISIWLQKQAKIELMSKIITV